MELVILKQPDFYLLFIDVLSFKTCRFKLGRQFQSAFDDTKQSKI